MKPLLKVTWYDATDHDDTWVDNKDIEKWSKELTTIISVGWLLRRNKNHVVLAGDDADGNWGRVTKIPTGWIIKEEILQTGS